MTQETIFSVLDDAEGALLFGAETTKDLKELFVARAISDKAIDNLSKGFRGGEKMMVELGFLFIGVVIGNVLGIGLMRIIAKWIDK